MNKQHEVSSLMAAIELAGAVAGALVVGWVLWIGLLTLLTDAVRW